MRSNLGGVYLRSFKHEFKITTKQESSVVRVLNTPSLVFFLIVAVFFVPLIIVFLINSASFLFLERLERSTEERSQHQEEEEKSTANAGPRVTVSIIGVLC